MRIQVFSQYYNLAQAGRVKPLACPMHKGEKAIFPLYHKEENNLIILNCHACNYKQIVGQTLYYVILQRVEAALKMSPKNEEPLNN
jgi:hypothetical protein